MKPVPFEDARDEARFGGKAVKLGQARASGLPTPPGYALDVDLVDAIVAGDASAIAAVTPIFHELGARVAVRSSAIGEDSERASFAGQHLTVLNVESVASMLEAVHAVRASAHTESARGYREKHGLEGGPRIAVAVQTLVRSEIAGVLFTVHPMTGADERVIEAAWGLGEAIVAGLVVPDTYRIARSGEVLERIAGDKDIELLPAPDGGTSEVEVDPDRATALCLDDAMLAQLHALALDCERYYGMGLDLEWAFVRDAPYLLQCRAITTKTAGR